VCTTTRSRPMTSRGRLLASFSCAAATKRSVFWTTPGCRAPDTLQGATQGQCSHFTLCKLVCGRRAVAAAAATKRLAFWRTPGCKAPDTLQGVTSPRGDKVHANLWLAGGRWQLCDCNTALSLLHNARMQSTRYPAGCNTPQGQCIYFSLYFSSTS
jgi:hypothetical protein